MCAILSAPSGNACGVVEVSSDYTFRKIFVVTSLIGEVVPEVALSLQFASIAEIRAGCGDLKRLLGTSWFRFQRCELLKWRRLRMPGKSQSVSTLLTQRHFSACCWEISRIIKVSNQEGSIPIMQYVPNYMPHPEKYIHEVEHSTAAKRTGSYHAMQRLVCVRYSLCTLINLPTATQCRY